MNNKIIRCCCCGKQVISGCTPSIYDRYTTTSKGAKAGFHSNEVFCGYCVEDLDENGLFPEEAALVYDTFE